MTLKVARVLPSQPVDVPHYVSQGAAADPSPVRLHRGEGHTSFDPATLSAEERAAGQARERGALLGLVAVPANVIAGPTTAADIGGRMVSLVPLVPAEAGAYTVCGVYDVE